MMNDQRIIVRLLIVAVLLTIPIVLIGACGGGYQDETTASPANVPKLGAAQLGAGAGPTPIPVTPTPTPTPSPTQMTLYDPVWEGTWTYKDNIKNFVVEFMPTKLVGEGADRRRDQGAMFVEGNDGWMALTFVRINEETGELSFRIPTWETNFKGMLEDDVIKGTSLERSVFKGTFELTANREQKPQRRKTIAPGE